MYAAVPTIMPASVWGAVIVGESSDCVVARPPPDLARPKSRTLTTPSGRILTLPGFEIAMDDAAFVRVVERVGDLPADGRRFVERQRTLLDALGQRRAVDQLHHEIVGADVVERRDVGMIERRDHLRLAREPLTEFLGRDLDGGVARQARVFGAIHLAHPPGADRADDLVDPKFRAGCERHRASLASN